jgi:hypothetical protein
MIAAGNTETVKTTSYKVVVPFYLYAALSLLIATILLFFSSSSFLRHYFQPHVLAITHTMALGCGTMIILGSSHQLVPVLIEGKLYSNTLAYASFVLAAIGIPLLVYGFYVFDMGDPAKWGGRFVLLAILAYIINLAMSMVRSKHKNVHAVFVLTAAVWLFLTAFLGLFLVYNFSYDLMPANSLHYLPMHAHAGIIGWFLLLIIGVGSRLIPMFLISKYTNAKLLWWIYALINCSLVGYTMLFYFFQQMPFALLPAVLLTLAVSLFIYYCYRAFTQRIRKKLDDQMKVSVLSVLMMAVPVLLLVFMIGALAIASKENIRVVLAYGFLIFFGWITAIILGMTFKTLPFIIWNKVYHQRSALGKTPSPKDLFSHGIFKIMSICYLAGIVVFTSGIFLSLVLFLNIGAALLIATAFLYNINVIKIVWHKPVGV